MIRINYAVIADMVTNLAGIKSPRGTITADARTNTLILTDIPEKVDEMISVIKTLDVKTPQVMIESKIVEVTRNFAQELGIQWGVFTERIDFSQPDQFPSLIRTGGDRSYPIPESADIAEDGLDPGFVVDLGIPSQPAGQFGVLLATLGLDHALDIQLEALEAQGKSRTIATPKVRLWIIQKPKSRVVNDFQCKRPRLTRAPKYSLWTRTWSSRSRLILRRTKISI